MRSLMHVIFLLCAVCLSHTVLAQPEPQNIPLNDQRAGSVLVFPFYSSGDAAVHDTRMTISNISGGNVAVHVMMMDGGTNGAEQSCEQLDFYLCLDKKQSCEILASVFDPMVNCGYLIAVVVDPLTGCPIKSNVLIGSAFVKMPVGKLTNAIGAGAVNAGYTAEAFAANSDPNPADCLDGKATLRFDGVVYDKIGKWLVTEIQAPSVVPGQTIVTVGLMGDLTNAEQTGAGQTSIGLVYNSIEKLASFSNFLIGQCQAKNTITKTSPRVVYTLEKFLNGGGNFGTIKIPIGGGVGLLITPENSSGWSGIRPLHKLTLLSGAALDIPTFSMTNCSTL